MLIFSLLGSDLKVHGAGAVIYLVDHVLDLDVCRVLTGSPHCVLQLLHVHNSHVKSV